MLSKDVSSTIFKVFGMTQPGIEPRSPGPLANTLATNLPFVTEKCLNTTYKGHLINKVKFPLGVGNRKHSLQLHLFQGNLWSCSISLSTWLSLLCMKSFHYWKINVSNPLTVFSTHARDDKSMFSSFVNIFFWLKYAFQYISHCTSHPPKVWWKNSVQALSTLICCHFE